MVVHVDSGQGTVGEQRNWCPSSPDSTSRRWTVRNSLYDREKAFTWLCSPIFRKRIRLNTRSARDVRACRCGKRPIGAHTLPAFSVLDKSTDNELLLDLGLIFPESHPLNPKLTNSYLGCDRRTSAYIAEIEVVFQALHYLCHLLARHSFPAPESQPRSR